MKTTKKTISLLLALVMLFTLASPVFASNAAPARNYHTYLCLGDSIAAGTSLRRDGGECVFLQDIDDADVWTVADDEDIFRGFNFEVAPKAYHSLIREGLISALGHDVKLIQGARSGLRAVEYRYLLDGIYNDYDQTHLWGNTFLNIESMIKELSEVGTEGSSPMEDLFTLKDVDDLNDQLKVGQRGRCDNYLEGFTSSDDSRINDPNSGYIDVSSYKEAVETADLISINLGSNDVFSYAFAVVLQNDDNISVPGFKEAAELLNKTGDIGAALAKLIETAETVGVAATLVEMFVSALFKSLDQFVENYKALVEAIYKINPNADIVAISCYNPLSHFHLAEGSNFNLDAIVTPFLLKMNDAIESFATGEHADHYFYVDVNGTDIHDMNLTDPLFQSYFMFKVHPTIAGHKFIADKVLAALSCDSPSPFAGNVHYIKLFEQLVKNVTGNIAALFAKLLESGFTFGPVSFGK